VASGTSTNSTNALGMARAAQDRSIKLQQALEGLELQQAELNATLLQLQTQAAATQAAVDARFLAQCEALLAAQQEQEQQEQDAVMRTQFVCQAQAGWSLPCPNNGAPTVVQALVGRFASAPDDLCPDARPAAQLAVCPASVEVTAQVRRAVGNGNGLAVVGRTPLQLLAEAGRVDPCPRAYKTLQVLYRCPAATALVLSPAARAEKCRQALAAAGGGAMMAAAP
jgi:hypothetical protein